MFKIGLSVCGHLSVLTLATVISLVFGDGMVLKEKALKDKTKPSGSGMMAETTHPSGIVNEVVGIKKGYHGHSCKEHDVCGVVVEEDTMCFFPG